MKEARLKQMQDYAKSLRDWSDRIQEEIVKNDDGSLMKWDKVEALVDIKDSLDRIIVDLESVAFRIVVAREDLANISQIHGLQ